MHTIFISDLHLTPDRPHHINAFQAFLSQQAPKAEKLYVLGDLFEYWIGDDAASEVGADSIIDSMRKVSQQLPCYMIVGNRDFLISKQFESETGFKLLADETIIDLYGRPTLLLHGDSLCTHDHAHMRFRSKYMNHRFRKWAFLKLPVSLRVKTAELARKKSKENKGELSMEIMDVADEAVENRFRHHQVNTMIHGHTHRQNTHLHNVDGRECWRYVLGDWGRTASILIAKPEGLTIQNPEI